MTVDLKSNTVKDEELSQAAARVVITTIFCLFILYFIFSGQTVQTEFIYFTFSYLLFSIIWIILVKKSPDQFVTRRYFVIFTDIGAVSIATFALKEWGGVMYAAYLWVILGNGMRFGQRHLFVALAAGVSGFSLILFFTPYWADHRPLGIGLLIGIIVLPMFYSVLIGRLHLLNEKLLLELDRSTYAATHDGLTSLLNRTYFVKRLTEEIHRCKRYNNIFCVIYIDLDNFKHVNDTYGHLQGDDVIIEIGKRLKESVRITDIAARMGGDEFALILLSMEKLSDIEAFAKKLIENLSRPITLENGEFTPSASIGVSSYPGCGDTVNSLVSSADTAMYVSKSKGKNTFSLSKSLILNASKTKQITT